MLQKNLFNKIPVIISCFFHFTQCIYKKLKKYGLLKTKLNKRNFEILRNIELICFIEPKYIKDYSTFLKLHLKEEKEIKLYKYL